MNAETRQQLIDQSVRVRSQAYAPFSKFLVGAALLCESGDVFSGVNVENSSYGLTCCAERTAVFAAVTAGHRKFEAVAVASSGGHGPCGACRQVLSEFGLDTIVLLVNADDSSQVEQLTVAELLPKSFRIDGDK